MDTEKIGAFLARLRHGAGYTQQQLAEKIGVMGKTVSRWETGRYLPPPDILQSLGALYGVTVDELLAGERTETQTPPPTAETEARVSDELFPPKEQLRFWQTKWKREHRAARLLGMCGILCFPVLGAAVHPCFFIGGIAGAVLYRIISYNAMMIYAEGHTFPLPKK